MCTTPRSTLPRTQKFSKGLFLTPNHLRVWWLKDSWSITGEVWTCAWVCLERRKGLHKALTCRNSCPAFDTSVGTLMGSWRVMRRSTRRSMQISPRQMCFLRVSYLYSSRGWIQFISRGSRFNFFLAINCWSSYKMNWTQTVHSSHKTNWTQTVHSSHKTNWTQNAHVITVNSHSVIICTLPLMRLIGCITALVKGSLFNLFVLFGISVVAYLKNCSRTNAPHTPRVILLGPTGSGKSVQAELLASKYNLANGKLRKNIMFW